jgi:hypothetical protein
MHALLGNAAARPSPWGGGQHDRGRRKQIAESNRFAKCYWGAPTGLGSPPRAGMTVSVIAKRHWSHCENKLPPLRLHRGRLLTPGPNPPALDLLRSDPDLERGVVGDPFQERPCCQNKRDNRVSSVVPVACTLPQVLRQTHTTRSRSPSSGSATTRKPQKWRSTWTLQSC